MVTNVLRMAGNVPCYGEKRELAASGVKDNAQNLTLTSCRTKFLTFASWKIVTYSFLVFSLLKYNRQTKKNVIDDPYFSTLAEV